MLVDVTFDFKALQDNLREIDKEISDAAEQRRAMYCRRNNEIKESVTATGPDMTFTKTVMLIGHRIKTLELRRRTVLAHIRYITTEDL